MGQEIKMGPKSGKYVKLDEKIGQQVTLGP